MLVQQFQGRKHWPVLSRVYQCRCKRPTFFRNSACVSCNTALGYEPRLGKVFPLAPSRKAEMWRLIGARAKGAYRRCANFETPAVCNWLVSAESEQALCISCRLNRTIPDLWLPENGVLWGRIEIAKRRVVSSLVSLGLPIASKVTEDPECGLAFDLLRSAEEGPRVMTGHADGIITMNIEEADDARREQIRAEMGEQYRTLVGHFRHEVGHYYWNRLISASPLLDGFRQLFGDEQQDYGAALRKHHELGPAAGWPANHVSAYASSHPWEDWAETWAHYMHIVDTVGTAISFGLNDDAGLEFEPFTIDMLYDQDHPDAAGFLSFLNGWIELSAVLNELARSMGQQDLYPFALPRAAVRKLHFIHIAVMGSRRTPL